MSQPYVNHKAHKHVSLQTILLIKQDCETNGDIIQVCKKIVRTKR